MSRTFRHRHLPSGGRHFVDSSVRKYNRIAWERLYSRIAHEVLKLPCKLDTSWRRPSHERCLPDDVRASLDLYSNVGAAFLRDEVAVSNKAFARPFVSPWGLVSVPSRTKKAYRKLVHREARHKTKRKLLIRGWTDYVPVGCCDGLCEPPKIVQRYELEHDADEVLFEDEDIPAQLARVKSWLT